MELEISGLKCDTPHCNYRDDNVKFEDYEKSIGRKCPLCQSNLLTQKDYDDCVKIYKLVKILNVIGSVLKWVNPFHYFRLLFGDKRKVGSLSVKYENDGTKTKVIKKDN